MNALFEHRKEDCEKHSLQMLKGEVQKLWDRCVVHIQQSMESRRYRDPREQDPDYGRRLRELEGQIAEIDREQQGFRMGDYHEGGGGSKWQQWILTIVGSLIAAGIGAVVYELADLKATMSASLARQEMDEQRLNRLEQHVYRGAP